MRVYDLRDLDVAARYRRGPGLLADPSFAARIRVHDEEPVPLFTAEWLQQQAYPGEWAAELGTSIEESSICLLTMQRPHVHRRVERELDRLREPLTRQVRLSVSMLSVGESDYRATFPPASPSVALPEEGRRRLAYLIASGGVEVLARADVVCLDGAGSHVTAGVVRDVCGRALLSGIVVELSAYLDPHSERVRLRGRVQYGASREDPPSTGRGRQFRVDEIVPTNTTALVGSYADLDAPSSSPRRLVALVANRPLSLEP